MRIDGTTRLIGIIGDPIAQVKAPAALNPMLAARGLNTVLVPFHVAPADLDVFVAGVRAVRNFDALVVTVPHKVAILRRQVGRPQVRGLLIGSCYFQRRR